MSFDKLIEKEIEELKLESLTHDVFENNKIKWLNDDEGNGYLGDKTKITYYRLFNTQVHDLEIANNKDVMRFTPIEIQNLIKSSITNSAFTKRTLFSAINNYMIYCIDRGHISTNPCDTISTEGLFDVNTRVLKSNYMKLNDFYRYIDDLNADDVQKMVYVLVRYGCPVKYIPEVTVKDIDFENKLLNVIIKDKFIKLTVDDMFLNMAKKSMLCDKTESGRSYMESEYLIRGGIIGQLNTSSIYTIIEKVSRKNGVQRPDLGMLYKNRRYDFVLDLKNEKEVINSNDLKIILECLGVSSTPSQLTSFKKEVLDIFGINVVDCSRVGNRNAMGRIIEVSRNGEILGVFKSAQKASEYLVDMGIKVSKTTIKNYASKGIEYNGLTFKFV